MMSLVLSPNQTCTCLSFQTALLNYNALKEFFGKYPEYNQTDFYISGFSYGGIYLPTLAMYLINDKNIYPNLKVVSLKKYLVSSEILTFCDVSGNGGW